MFESGLKREEEYCPRFCRGCRQRRDGFAGTQLIGREMCNRSKVEMKIDHYKYLSCYQVSNIECKTISILACIMHFENLKVEVEFKLASCAGSILPALP